MPRAPANAQPTTAANTLLSARQVALTTSLAALVTPVAVAGRTRDAIRVLREIDDEFGLGAVLDTLGHVHHLAGRYTEATESCRSALAVRRRIGDHRGTVESLLRLGDARAAAGDLDAARAGWTEALALATDLDLPAAAEANARLASALST